MSILLWQIGLFLMIMTGFCSLPTLHILILVCLPDNFDTTMVEQTYHQHQNTAGMLRQLE